MLCGGLHVVLLKKLTGYLLHQTIIVIDIGSLGLLLDAHQEFADHVIVVT